MLLNPFFILYLSVFLVCYNLLKETVIFYSSFNLIAPQKFLRIWSNEVELK